MMLTVLSLLVVSALLLVAPAEPLWPSSDVLQVMSELAKRQDGSLQSAMAEMLGRLGGDNISEASSAKKQMLARKFWRRR